MKLYLKSFIFFIISLFVFQAICPNKYENMSSGDHYISIRSVNDTLIHIPPNYNTENKFPLLFALHGLGENYASNFQKEINLDNLADLQNFITIYPLGSESWSETLFGHTWNGGKCCFSNENDSEFLVNVINSVKDLVCEDETRIYMMGFSAGGVMSHTMACENSDIIAAIVSIDGPIETTNDCKPKRSVPILHFHGTLDIVFPIDGAIFNGAKQTIETWKNVNKCIGDPVEIYNKNSVYGISYNNCNEGTEVQFYKVYFGLHSWPPSVIEPEKIIWNFLNKFKLEQNIYA